ncbi:DsbA family oxidoreductase [Glycomyces xiaoerkulensis]|uniref:DsbA family oxidoreductase n=1 Tax=Glycomyces xiaoerkulensis TaxID=2038139 RepID=UPI000C257860
MRIDIWSDVACPWCYVGKARFDKAAQAFAHADDIEVRHRSFELDPTAPPGETTDVISMLASKYGITAENAQANERRLGELAAAEGLDYRTEGRDTGNTFDLHRLLHLAADKGLEAEVWRAFYAANFAEETSLFERDRIVRVAVGAGLEQADVVAVLDDPDAYADAVRGDEAEAARLGARGVPFFVVDGKYGISGAQPTELFAEILETAWGEREPKLTSIAGDAGSEACGPDGCTP